MNRMGWECTRSLTLLVSRRQAFKFYGLKTEERDRVWRDSVTDFQKNARATVSSEVEARTIGALQPRLEDLRPLELVLDSLQLFDIPVARDLAALEETCLLASKPDCEMTRQLD